MTNLVRTVRVALAGMTLSTAAWIATPAHAAPSAPSAPSAAEAPVNGVAVGDVTVAGGEIANATDVVQAMRPGFGRCYDKGLATNPDAAGQVTITIRVGVAGQILGVATQHTAKVPPVVVSCITGRAASSEFAVPKKTKKKVDTTVSAVITLTRPS